MAIEIYDRLAELLKEMHGRYPDDAFKNRKRLNGLLADHVKGGEREIRIVLDAIDEGVVDDLTNAPEHEVRIQIDRLVTRLENRRGIREDIARQAVHACAFGIGVGGLPSTVAANPANDDREQQDPEDWAGLSKVVDSPRKPDPVDPNYEHSADIKNKKYLWIAVAVAIGFITFTQLKSPPSELERSPQPPQGDSPQEPRTQPDMDPLMVGEWKNSWHDGRNPQWCHVSYDAVGNWAFLKGCPDAVKNGRGTIRLSNGTYTSYLISGMVVDSGTYQFINEKRVQMVRHDGLTTYWDRVR